MAASFARPAVYLVPICFVAGLWLKEQREANERIDAIVEKRVQQRLGEWTPPPLPPGAREELLRERAAVLEELAKLARRRQQSSPAG